MNNFDQTLNGFFTEAKTVCGSEGLYQSIFYHHLRKYYSDTAIQREVVTEGGKVDFLVSDNGKLIGVEIKAGANGHRNSLANMKEVESKGKGLQHDLAKLASLPSRLKNVAIENWLICVDISPLGIAFSDDDLQKYSTLSNSLGTSFAYLSQLEESYRIWNNNKETRIELSKLEMSPCKSPRELVDSEELWNNFFAAIKQNNGPECSHVGVFYHTLRKAGLGHNQVASEVFFNCSRYGERKYYIPDLAVFEPTFPGCFQLYGNNKRTIENDQFKIPNLVSMYEFKGGNAFSKLSLNAKIQNILSDLQKISNELQPRLTQAWSVHGQTSSFKIPTIGMVITDSDPRLSSTLSEVCSEYRGRIDLRWAGIA